MFYKFLLQFTNNIEGLREFIDLIHPFLNEYHKKEIEKHDDGILPLVLARRIKLEEDQEKKSQLEEKLKEVFQGEIEVIIEEGEGSNDRFSYRIKGDTTRIDQAFRVRRKSIQQKNLLYINSLISLLSSAEWFFSQILHFYYNENPGAASIKKNTLTLEELKSFGSVEDAEKYLIDSKIEGILRSNFSDWIEVLKKDLSLGMGYIDKYSDQLIEIYQRRNILIHNGGIVNSIYLSKVPAAISGQTKSGDKLLVDEEYLDNSLNLIHILFSLIACELWKKMLPEDTDRANYLMELSYGYLLRENWEMALMPNTFLKGDSKLLVIPRTYAQLNCWLCQKRSGSNLTSELSKIDFSDKSLTIQLALFSLRDEKSEFFNVLPKALSSGDLLIEDLFQFPIFKDMRKTKEFEIFKAESIDAIEYLKTHIELPDSTDTRADTEEE